MYYDFGVRGVLLHMFGRHHIWDQRKNQVGKIGLMVKRYTIIKLVDRCIQTADGGGRSMQPAAWGGLQYFFCYAKNTILFNTIIVDLTTIFSD